MVKKIAIILLAVSVMALLGIGYLQFSDQSLYVVSSNLPRYHQITEENLAEQRFARLRDRKLNELIIFDKNQIIGKYASRDLAAGEIFVNNGMLLDRLPPGRCFSSGRCLEDSQTAWVFNADAVDTLGGRVGLDDYVDIVLIDTTNKRLTFLVQKIKPLEVKDAEFLFGFTPEQVAVLRGITAEGQLKIGLLLNQEPNQLQQLLQQYSMDYRQVPSNLFPLPTPTPTPAPGETPVTAMPATPTAIPTTAAGGQ